MSNEMTPWFPSHIKPVRVGVYQVNPKYHSVPKPVYAHWNGRHWGYFTEDIRRALNANTYELDASQEKEWRGFTEKQE